jgi:hypothetical protein
MEAANCPADEVCWVDPSGQFPSWICVNPWTCADDASITRDDAGARCRAEYDCVESGRLEAECWREGNAAFCTCSADATGEVFEMQFERSVCDPDEEQYLLDRLNTGCGWRLPK